MIAETRMDQGSSDGSRRTGARHNHDETPLMRGFINLLEQHRQAAARSASAANDDGHRPLLQGLRYRAPARDHTVDNQQDNGTDNRSDQTGVLVASTDSHRVEQKAPEEGSGDAE